MDGDQRIYMRQPPGYYVPGKEGFVCELQKSIYGLKQAPRIWYGVLHQFLTKMGFVRCNKEFCIYVQKVGDEWVIIVDLGDIHYILKMEVRRNRVEKTTSISQHQYILELLKKYKID
ncbi:Gag-pol Polyprotein [Phytophthora megakarya]|uniref:Gag-pol Polyprotein n=1 Tax=Phytophthora megakarya TaxID=4795 RepID=A0A225V716_9STRA|nr:Gag-pol Polyprotein [Phytophthora megakarya]